MELLLNLAWLGLSLLAALHWTFKARRYAEDIFLSQTHRALVLGCVLVLMFPVISVTDDLQAALIFAEGPPRAQDSLRDSSAQHRNTVVVFQSVTSRLPNAPCFHLASSRVTCEAPCIRSTDPQFVSALYRRPPPSDLHS